MINIVNQNNPCNLKCLIKSINIYFYLATINLSCGYRSPERERERENYLLCCTEEIKSHRFGTSWDWVNDDRIIIIIFFSFWNCLFKYKHVLLITAAATSQIHSLLNVRSICEHEHHSGLPVHAPASLQGSDWPLRVPAGRSSSESRECSPVVCWFEEWFLFWDLLGSRAMLDLAFFSSYTSCKH